LISVIVPTYNNGDTIVEVLTAIKRSASHCNGKVEVIVTDNGSTDGTMSKVASHPLPTKIIQCNERGIGINKNHGALYARGDTLVFIHGDDVISEGFLPEVERTALDPSVVGGGARHVIPFRWSLSVALFFLIAIKKCVFHHITIGAFWCKLEHFWDIGGFSRSQNVLEDIEFALRMKRYCKRYGLKRKSIQSPLYWSTRRFDEDEWWWAKHLLSFLKAVYTCKLNKHMRRVWYGVS